MSLAESWPTVPIRATYYRPDGTPAKGQVDFTLTADGVSPDGTAEVVGRPNRVTLVNGSLPDGFALPATDAEGVTPSGLSYQVTVTVELASTTFSILVPVADQDDGIDLLTVAPLADPLTPGSPIATAAALEEETSRAQAAEAEKAPIDSPEFTGTPLGPDGSELLTQVAARGTYAPVVDGVVPGAKLASLASPDDTLPNEIPFWWTTDPVAVGGRVYAGTAGDNSDVYVQEWSQPNAQGPYWLRRYLIGYVQTGGMDDHIAAGIAAKVGKPLAAFTSAHNTDNVIFYRLTTQNIEDIKPGAAEFGPVQRYEIPADEATSYAITMVHGDDILILHRSGDATRWSLTKFGNWTADDPVRYEVFSSVDQFYVTGRVVGDVIRCIVSDHPTLGTDNKVWYCEIDLTTGSITKADGTVLGNIDGTNLPLAEADLDLVFTSPGTEKPWTFDVGYDADTPEITFVSGENYPNYATTAYYYYGTYTDGAWETHQIVKNGSILGGAYFPSIVFTPNVLGSLILAREEDGTDYVEQWVTADGGSTWTTTVLDTSVPATDTTLTRVFTVRAVDGSTPLFDVMATEIDTYATYTGPWVARFRPLPRDAQVKRIPDAPRLGVAASAANPGPAQAGLYLPGTAGTYIKGPTTSPSSTGFRVEVDCALDNWASGAIQNLLAKEDDSTHREFRLYVGADGKIGIYSSPDGTTAVQCLPNDIPGFTPGQRVQLYAEFVPSWFGGTQYRLRVGYRGSDDEPWTQLSATQLTPQTSVMATTSAWEIGARWLGTTELAAGKFYRASVLTYGGKSTVTEWRGDLPNKGWSVQGGTTAIPVYTSAWNGPTPLKLGTDYLWFDAANRLRRSVGAAPTSDTAGVAVGDPPVLSSTNFDSATDAINTTGKYPGRPAYCTTHARPHWTNGLLATSTWLYADGTTAHTPS